MAKISAGMIVMNAVMLLALALAGCGGGGGTASVGQGMHLPAEPDPPQGTAVSVSTGTGPILVQGPEVYEDHWNGPAAAKVVEYLGAHASGGPWYGLLGEYSHEPFLARFVSPPTVRLAAGASDRERAYVAHAVAILNRSLPYDKHLTIGMDAPAGLASSRTAALPTMGNVEYIVPYAGDVPDGQFIVEYIDGTGHVPGAAHQDVVRGPEPAGETKSLRAAAVVVDRWDFPVTRDSVSLLIHELLHAVGLQGHVGCGGVTDGCTERFPRSTMNYGQDAYQNLDDGSLPSIDQAALQVLYTRMGEATRPEDLSLAGFGPWERQAVNLTGQIGSHQTGALLAFGVRHRNGISVPWTDGHGPCCHPNHLPDDNPALSGTVTWRGELVGLRAGERIT